MDFWGFVEPDDSTVYLGKIKTVVTYAVFVAFDGDCLGLVHHSKISGCDNKDDLPKICKVGDKMRVKIDQIDPRDGRMTLNCVEFPVKDDSDNG